MKKILILITLFIFNIPYYVIADSILHRDAEKDNVYWPLQGTGTSDNPYTSAASLRELVAFFQLGSYRYLDKFGENENVATGPEDIWEFGGEYPVDTSAVIVSISSSDVDDDQEIEIVGQDAEYNEIVQTITLQGQTRVALDTSLMLVYRASNVNGTEFEGTVYIYTGTTNTLGVPADANVRAIITEPNQQTQMALYTVPRGKVGFLYRGELGMLWDGTFQAGVESAKMHYKSKRAGEVYKVKKTIGLMTHGNSNYIDERIFPDIVPSGTNIKLTAFSTSAEMGFIGAFDMLIVDESEFSGAFLTAIGQLGY